eukprot:TRINITY_DN13237_c0_g1_i1.p2 TRINITY_DN13237_c0_g1~~TRINITY_DN13237_c0_g1_i1.p2  ORF type:complete len:114 (-),score=33.83 TRINITY_DN13237_c0_g1_i1:90-431(-)
MSVPMVCQQFSIVFFFFFSSRRRHTRCREVSWARRCVQETGPRDPPAKPNDSTNMKASIEQPYTTMPKVTARVENPKPQINSSFHPKDYTKNYTQIHKKGKIGSSFGACFYIS